MLPPPLQQLSRLVRDIADRHLPPRLNGCTGDYKSDGSLVTEVDVAIQAGLCAAVQAQWPDIALLGEEMSEDRQRAALESASCGVWCIDPLDGTSNFASGIPYYAVSVALVKNCRPELAVVYDPNRGECFTAARGRGAWLNEKRLRQTATQTSLATSIALVDFKRLPAALAARLASTPPYQSQRSFGAGALDWCWLASGRVQVYVHGRQKLWDYAAGCLVLDEAGGHSATLSGEAVFSPSLQPRSVAAALDPSLFEQWRDWLGLPTGAGDQPLR